MTTGTTLVLYKQALVTALAARPGLAGKQVAYEFPLPKPASQAIWLGGATAETTIPTMRAGTKKVDEAFTLLVIAQALETEGGGQLVADTAALALFLEVQQQLAETPQLIPEIQWSVMTGWEHNPGVFGVDDSGGDASRGSRFEIRVTVRARLGS